MTRTYCPHSAPSLRTLSGFLSAVLPAFAVAILFVAGAAQAAGFRATDTRLSAAETEAALNGHSIEFYDGSVARYGPGTNYSYTYEPGDAPFIGTYLAGDGGEVCVTFANGSARCDTYVMADGRLVLIIEDGTRFPVRQVMPLD